MRMLAIFPTVGFAGLFVAMWLRALRQDAQRAWLDIARMHRAGREPFGTKIGAVSGAFARCDYSGALSVWVAPDELLVRPIILFRAYHPTLLVPWSAVDSVSEGKRLWSKWTLVEGEIEGMPFALEFPGSHEAKIEPHLRRAESGRAEDERAPGGVSRSEFHLRRGRFRSTSSRSGAGFSGASIFCRCFPSWWRRSFTVRIGFFFSRCFGHSWCCSS